MTIRKGDKISIEYEGKLENGEIFDSTNHGDHHHSFEFIVGSGEVIKGFDEAAIGMELNQEKEISIGPENAYGTYDEKYVREVPRNLLPAEPEPQEEMTLVMKTPDGRQMLATIKKVTNENVQIDLNHPLAGKKLNFKIKIVGINKINSNVK
ncbi:MAG: peptidylprolyl isomerase [Nanoarchaeota archaeon]|nr:peptidylprolyl isomerase [Nanoarchaeota archaeon]